MSSHGYGSEANSLILFRQMANQDRGEYLIGLLRREVAVVSVWGPARLHFLYGRVCTLTPPSRLHKGMKATPILGSGGLKKKKRKIARVSFQCLSRSDAEGTWTADLRVEIVSFPVSFRAKISEDSILETTEGRFWRCRIQVKTRGFCPCVPA